MSPIHYTFIDLENVPHVDLAVLEGHPVHTTILIGARQKKLDLDLVRRIHRLGSRVDLVEVGASGRNALDLTLACYLGRALEKHPQASFSIISRDRDFDPMIAHLRARGIEIARHPGVHTVERAAPAPAAQPPASRPATPAPRRGATRPAASATARRTPDDRTERIVARLENPNNPNRPARRRGLLAQIKSSLGKGASDADAAEVLHQLEARGVLVVDDKDRVVYAND